MSGSTLNVYDVNFSHTHTKKKKIPALLAFGSGTRNTENKKIFGLMSTKLQWNSQEEMLGGKLPRNHAIKVYGGGGRGCKSPSIFDLGTRWGWMVGFTSPPGEGSISFCIGD
jgi:hypothetical protein